MNGRDSRGAPRGGVRRQAPRPAFPFNGHSSIQATVGQTQTFPDGTTKYSEYRIGGTSLSCPIFAGIMALADQAKGARHGFANPKLYALPSPAFHDVQAPQTPVAMVRADFNDFVSASSGLHFTLRTLDQTLSLETGPGYDDVTGRGSPTASFIDTLAK